MSWLIGFRIKYFRNYNFTKIESHVHVNADVQDHAVQYVHVHAACPSTCYMFMFMLHAHVYAACPYPFCMSLSVQHGHGHENGLEDADGHVHAAEIWTAWIHAHTASQLNATCPYHFLHFV